MQCLKNEQQCFIWFKTRSVAECFKPDKTHATRTASKTFVVDLFSNRGIHAEVIVYIFAHLHTALRTDKNLLGIYWLQAAKELVKLDTGLNF